MMLGPRSLGLALLLLTSGSAQASVSAGFGYTADVMSNLTGGMTRGTRALGLLEASLTVDGGDLGLAGVEAFLNLQYAHGQGPTDDLIGDLQTVSNIEAPSALRPLEAWLSAPIAGDAVRAKLGLIDLNAVFDVQDVGALFVGSSHGIGPDFSQSGENGPSIYPTTALALVLEAEPAANWAVRLGAFDGVAGDPDRPRRTTLHLSEKEGALLVAEVERSLGKAAQLQIGAWTYTARFDALEPGAPRGHSRGAYAMLQAGHDALSGWVRVGVADADVNPVAAYVGGGLVYTGLGAPEAQLGLAVAHARLGRQARTLARSEGWRANKAETAVELSYAYPLHPWLTVQPNLHYIVNPSADARLGDAVVAGLRLSIMFE